MTPPGALRITHSVFDARDLATLLSTAYLGGAPAACELFSRSWTDVYRLFAPHTVYAARVWRSGFHGRAHIDFECAHLAALSAQGLPVPVPMPLGDGGFTLLLEAPEGPRVVGLFEWADGDKVGASVTAGDATRMGDLLARIHLAGRDTRADPVSFARPLEDHFDDLAHVLRYRGIDADPILRGMADVSCAMAEAETSDLPRGLIHGDFQPGNVLRRADGSSFAIDFDDVTPGLLLRDLANFRWALERLGRLPLFDDFLAGYRRHRAVGGGELALVPLFEAERDCWVIGAWASNINALGDPQGAFDAFLKKAPSRFASLGLR